MEHPEVNTKCGRLRGLKQKSIDGFDLFAFKGIPYAKPPVRELRFQDPVPAAPWTGTKDAFDFGPIAAQYDFFFAIKDGSDDCLYLNVYTKNIEPKVQRPVMVWIHGGGFVFGSGNDLLYGPDYLLRKDVVLVTINYRLGVLGFLNLEDEIAPGNQGLKDQVMALRWVRYNIANFGGDPDNVTIFGESAGGASVHYLTISPLAKGLFHRAIAQSGVATNLWASVPKDPKEHAYKLCSILGKEIRDHKEIVKFLRTVDAMKLVEAQEKVERENFEKLCLFQFGPGVDAKSPNPFLPIPIDEAFKQGAHVPFMLGHANREGIYMMKTYKVGDYEDRNSKFESYIHPHTMKMLKENNLTPNDLRYMYFKNEKISKDNYETLVDFVGDMMFVHDIHDVIGIQVERNSAPTYMYQFTYDKDYCFSKLMHNDQTSGASHMDELIYLFGMKFFDTLKVPPLKKNTKDYKIMEQMVELWTNFAKTGRPTPVTTDVLPLHWEPVVNAKVLRYMNIGEKLHMDKMLNINERFSVKQHLKKIEQ